MYSTRARLRVPSIGATQVISASTSPSSSPDRMSRTAMKPPWQKPLSVTDLPCAAFTFSQKYRVSRASSSPVMVCTAGVVSISLMIRM